MSFQIKTRGGKVLLDESILKSNAKELTDDQLKVVGQLVENVLKEKIQDTHSGYDEVMTKATGVNRPTDQKSYEFWPSAVAKIKADSIDTSALDDKIKTLEATNADLQKKIDDGVGKDGLVKELRSTIENNESVIGKLREDAKKANTDWQEKYDKVLSDNHDRGVDAVFAKVRTEIPFLKSANDTLVKTVFDAAVSSLKSKYQTVFDGDQLRFQKDKVTHTNPNNQRNPYTAKELVLEELKGTGIIDEAGGQRAGGGTKKPKEGNTGTGGSIVVNATTKTGLMKEVTQQLRQNGVRAGSEEWNNQLDQAKEDHNWAEMPLK